MEPMTEESAKEVAIPSRHQTINPFDVNLTFQFQPKLRPVSSSIKVWIVDTSLVNYLNFSRLLPLGKNNQIFYTSEYIIILWFLKYSVVDQREEEETTNDQLFPFFPHPY